MAKGTTVAGPLSGHNNSVWAVAFLPDQEHVVSRSGFRTVRVWNVKTGHQAMEPFTFKKVEIPTGTIDSAVYYEMFFLHDRSRIESGFAPCSWKEAMEREEEEYRPHGRSSYWVQASAFSPDGKFVATHTHNRTHVWNAASGPFVDGRVTCLAFSGDGQQIASGSKGGIVRVWNIGIADKDPSGAVKQWVPFALAFSLDSKQIVVGRADDAVIYQLDRKQ